VPLDLKGILTVALIYKTTAKTFGNKGGGFLCVSTIEI